MWGVCLLFMAVAIATSEKINVQSCNNVVTGTLKIIELLDL